MGEGKIIKLVDDPAAPEIYCTRCTGIFKFAGNVTLTLESARVDYSSSGAPISRVVVGRLTMPISCAQTLVVALNDYLEKNGLSPAKAVAGSGTPQ